MARKKKQNIILENILIEDYAAEGKSIARVDGKVVFVEQVVPGDVVDVRLGKNKKDWAEGVPIAFKAYSKERLTPFCSHFGVCGGCQWQMLPYQKQLQYKHQQVKDNLQRIGKIALPEIPPILGAAADKGYRNKIEYTFGTELFLPKEQFNQLKEQGVNPYEFGRQPVAGFHAKGFWDKIVDLQTCYLQQEPTNAIRLAIKDFAKVHDYSFYDLRQHTGFLRTLQLRLCETGELMVNVVLGEDDEEKRLGLLEHLLKQFPQITTLLYTINTKRNDSLHDLDPIAYKGKGYVVEKLEDYSFKIGPKSFFQTNTRQAEQLYRVTRDFAELSGSETLYDLYCGTGSIGIFCSKQAGTIIGVEMIDAAIEDAKENAALNSLEKTHFYAGDVIDICNDAFFEQHGRPDVIVTDPPRAGMHEKLVRKINEMAAPTVVYVSCNPATQARDLALLDEKYQVTKVQPVDMFPHTLHIENVVQLKLREEAIKTQPTV
ncbi:23S rRNA (uracil(1939)-C(5))-methyltransferase RlmD [Niabella soli]|uniref:RNA methyltransferase n=1 Tax=Niabella soli DSM 19437 TaxID=929713 RepID=W0EZ62_9BACT|nr:23S rRNA (uracil(1939)-C(5))-methyltransferase RlmD [Niabella soli]AHF16095.1 RNA methyltransferase [Niabella soli DSM 19437]